jgi:hypothetical protein
VKLEAKFNSLIQLKQLEMETVEKNSSTLVTLLNLKENVFVWKKAFALLLQWMRESPRQRTPSWMRTSVLG